MARPLHHARPRADPRALRPEVAPGFAIMCVCPSPSICEGLHGKGTMPTDVVMPQMGESIFEGTITKWLKKPGDKVQRDEPLFEISTDKVDAEIPAPASGTLQEIKVSEGNTVQVNTVVGVIGDGSAAPPSAPAKAAAPAPAAPDAHHFDLAVGRRLALHRLAARSHDREQALHPMHPIPEQVRMMRLALAWPIGLGIRPPADQAAAHGLRVPGKPQRGRAEHG